MCICSSSLVVRRILTDQFNPHSHDTALRLHAFWRGSPNLRILRLNIDFHDTCGLHPVDKRVKYTPWLDSEATFAQRPGTEIMEAACPLLEHAALLQHPDTASVWEQWKPPWPAGKGRIDWALDTSSGMGRVCRGFVLWEAGAERALADRDSALLCALYRIVGDGPSGYSSSSWLVPQGSVHPVLAPAVLVASTAPPRPLHPHGHWSTVLSPRLPSCSFLLTVPTADVLVPLSSLYVSTSFPAVALRNIPCHRQRPSGMVPFNFTVEQMFGGLPYTIQILLVATANPRNTSTWRPPDRLATVAGLEGVVLVGVMCCAMFSLKCSGGYASPKVGLILRRIGTANVVWRSRNGEGDGRGQRTWKLKGGRIATLFWACALRGGLAEKVLRCFSRPAKEPFLDMARVWAAVCGCLFWQLAIGRRRVAAGCGPCASAPLDVLCAPAGPPDDPSKTVAMPSV
ncbi:hypothetical protein C8Q74DRAFT_1439598, partial [Fomes fomentarius]